MSYFTVKLEKVSNLTWNWCVEKDGRKREAYTYSFTKAGAKRAAAKAISKWDKNTITEIYTVKAE